MATTEEVKLLGFWASPFSRRVEWALKRKGVDYEYIEEDIFNKSNLIIDLNPVHKKVPVLVHQGKVIAESFIILQYIDETWTQNPLLPQLPYERAISHFWSRVSEEKLLESGWKALISEGEEKKNALNLAREVVEHIEGELKRKKFFGGEEIGYVDIALGWISYWLPIWEHVGSMQIIDPLKFPCITAWEQNFLSHPLIKDNLPPRDKLIAYFQKRREDLIAFK